MIALFCSLKIVPSALDQKLLVFYLSEPSKYVHLKKMRVLWEGIGKKSLGRGSG